MHWQARAGRSAGKRWHCGTRRSGGSAGKSTVTAMDGPAMRGRRDAKHGDGDDWDCEGSDWRSAGMAMHSQAKGTHSSEEQRKGAGLICGAWAKHRSATQRRGIAGRRHCIAAQRHGIASRGTGREQESDAPAWKRRGTRGSARATRSSVLHWEATAMGCRGKGRRDNAEAMDCVAVASDRAGKRSLAMRRHGKVVISTGEALES